MRLFVMPVTNMCAVMVHANIVESVWSVFKRGMHGTYQHCGEAHLHRYRAEFDFRYNYRVKFGYSDTARALIALKGIGGKRLMYLRPAQGLRPRAN